jgi:hypothetical protein
MFILFRFSNAGMTSPVVDMTPARATLPARRYRRECEMGMHSRIASDPTPNPQLSHNFTWHENAMEVVLSKYGRNVYGV